MKTSAKIIFYVLSFFLLLLTFLHFVLIYILPLESVKNKIISTIEKNTNASVSINKISASLLDFSLDNVDILSENEKFAHIGKVHIYFSPLHLLKGKIKILTVNLDTVEINIVKDDSGRYNFENLLKPGLPVSQSDTVQKKETAESIINLLLCKTNIQNVIIRYADRQNKLNIDIKDLSFYIEQFSFDEVFKVNAAVQLDAGINDMRFDSLYFALTSFVNLHSLDLTKAELNIANFAIKFKETSFLCRIGLGNRQPRF